MMREELEKVNGMFLKRITVTILAMIIAFVVMSVMASADTDEKVVQVNFSPFFYTGIIPDRRTLCIQYLKKLISCSRKKMST